MVWSADARLLLATVLIYTAQPGFMPAQSRPIPSGQISAGMLSFDGHATVGDFTGSTTTVKGQISGASDLAGVRGWVEAPVETLKTGDNRRDKDLNKSMESKKYPVLRFDLERIAPAGSGEDIPVILHGALSIHGVRRTVELPATIRFSGWGRKGTWRLSVEPEGLQDWRAQQDARHAEDERAHRGPRRPLVSASAVLKPENTGTFRDPQPWPIQWTIRSLPSRETTTVRWLSPRVSRRVAFDKPRVRPSGEKVNWRAGPASVTCKADGPGSDQNGMASPLTRMASCSGSTVSTRTWFPELARSRAR